MEMVDIMVLETMAERRGGSSPSSGTIAAVMELADMQHLKCCAHLSVWVQIPSAVQYLGVAQLGQSA